jgi:predicted porin
MKRKALAVAVGALFVAPAAQAQITFGNEQLGTLQIYGKIYPQLGFFSSHGATQPGTTGVSTLVGSGATPATLNTLAGVPGTVNEEPQPRASVDVGNSYVGFRGERSINRDLKAIFQIETATNFDVGTGTWGSRNSFGGLSSKSFGTVKLGNMDTVYKEYGDTFSMFGIASGNFVSASNVLSQSIDANRTARFHERRTNSINYETPTFANVTAGIMYGPDEAKTGSRNQKLWSYGVKWDTERFYASVHQEKHYDFFGLSNSIANTGIRNGATAANGTFTPGVGAHSTDTATRFSGEMRFPTWRVVLDLARLNYDESQGTLAGARVSEYKHNNWALGWDGGFGPYRVAVQYVRAGKGSCTLTTGSCTTDGLEAWQLNAGVRYRFDRQTFVYLIGSKLNNGASAAYNNNSTETLPIGSDSTNVALGISYSF